MYTNTKKKNNKKKKMIVSLSFLLLLSVGVLTYGFQAMNEQEDTPVFHEQELPVITLPDSEQEEKAIRPYTVEAQIVLKHYDPNSEDSNDMTLFEGKYRGNEGIDYAFEDQAFDVVSIYSGVVSDVKEDPLFGHSLTVTSGEMVITYQSLDAITLSDGDQVSQGDTLGQAGVNVYNKDLNHHVHIVAKKGTTLFDPESIYDKRISEIK